jgi:hypothetical protein
MKEEMTAKLKAKREANKEKFESLRSTLVSGMDIYQARAEAIKEELKA